MKKFKDCNCLCHHSPGLRHMEPCCDQTYKQRELINSEPPLRSTLINFFKKLSNIYGDKLKSIILWDILTILEKEDVKDKDDLIRYLKK